MSATVPAILDQSQGRVNRIQDSSQRFDAVVVGAGFSGLYALQRLRSQGLSVRVYEAAGDIGGTWYWNRYPGARCDTESEFYCFSFSDELLQGWQWSERFPGQPEILRYFDYVDKKLNLRKDVQFNTRVDAASFDEAGNRWTLRLDDGNSVSAKYLILGVGTLSVPTVPRIEGLERFKGKTYSTSRWPHERVDFAGQRVGVIGTGSSGVQSIPVIAEQAAHLYVFQRTPAYYVPARNTPIGSEQWEDIREHYSELWNKARQMPMGLPYDRDPRSAFDLSPEEREEFFATRWKEGGNKFLRTGFKDTVTNKAANDTVVAFLHRKIKETVRDPAVADKLMARGFPVGTKRICSGTDYLETFNRDNVTLVDVRSSPIEEITPAGVRTKDAEYTLDALVLATGFDAMTGPFTAINIRGVDGASLKEKWTDGPHTYLGIMTSGFPNLFMVTGPQSPSVLCNVPPAIEQHVEWITDCIRYMQSHGYNRIDADAEAEREWGAHCQELANQTLFPTADSWYMGANIPGKPRVFMVYVGGLDKYSKKCDEVVGNGYEGFHLAS